MSFSLRGRFDANNIAGEVLVVVLRETWRERQKGQVEGERRGSLGERVVRNVRECGRRVELRVHACNWTIEERSLQQCRHTDEI